MQPKRERPKQPGRPAVARKRLTPKRERLATTVAPAVHTPSLRFLYWNFHQAAARTEIVSELIHERRADIVVLTEHGEAEGSIVSPMKQNFGRSFKRANAVRPAELTPLVLFDPTRVTVLSRRGDSTYERVEGYSVVSAGALDFTLVVAHLLSGVREPPPLKGGTLNRFRERVEAIEDQLSSTRTIVVGDLNSNPFDMDAVSAVGLHAVSHARLASEEGRVVDSVEYDFFYNPMWSKLGDQGDSPGGTYFWKSPGEHAYYWHILDHVLLRPSMIASLRAGHPEIVTRVGTRSLLTNDRPDPNIGSDHLPLYFEIVPPRKE